MKKLTILAIFIGVVLSPLAQRVHADQTVYGFLDGKFYNEAQKLVYFCFQDGSCYDANLNPVQITINHPSLPTPVVTTTPTGFTGDTPPTPPTPPAPPAPTPPPAPAPTPPSAPQPTITNPNIWFDSGQLSNFLTTNSGSSLNSGLTKSIFEFRVVSSTGEYGKLIVKRVNYTIQSSDFTPQDVALVCYSGSGSSVTETITPTHGTTPLDFLVNGYYGCESNSIGFTLLNPHPGSLTITVNSVQTIDERVTNQNNSFSANGLPITSNLITIQ